jgi:hypothetical protein
MKNFKAIFVTTVLGAFAPLAIAADPPPEQTTEPETATTVYETTPLTVSKAARSSGFISANNRMYFLHNGRSYPVTTQYLLRVDRSGITGFDGRPVPLLKGHMLTAKGEIVPLPKDIKGLPAPSKAPPAPETPLPEPPAD